MLKNYTWIEKWISWWNIISVRKSNKRTWNLAIVFYSKSFLKKCKKNFHQEIQILFCHGLLNEISKNVSHLVNLSFLFLKHYFYLFEIQQNHGIWMYKLIILYARKSRIMVSDLARAKRRVITKVEFLRAHYRSARKTPDSPRRSPYRFPAADLSLGRNHPLNYARTLLHVFITWAISNLLNWLDTF